MAEQFVPILAALIGLRLSVIDLAEHRLPDRLTLPLAAFMVSLTTWIAPDERMAALVGASSTTVAMALMALLPGNPLGWGDVKFQWSLGWVLGTLNPVAAWWGVVGTFVLGGAHALVVLLSPGGASKERIALGPWMLASTLVVFIAERTTEGWI